LRAKIGDTPVLDLARETLKIARAGLEARGALDGWGESEAKYLATLEQTADAGLTPAEQKLEAFHGRWEGDASHAFAEYTF
jgi:glutamate--cysteine ligase